MKSSQVAYADAPDDLNSLYFEQTLLYVSATFQLSKVRGRAATEIFFPSKACCPKQTLRCDCRVHCLVVDSSCCCWAWKLIIKEQPSAASR